MVEYIGANMTELGSSVLLTNALHPDRKRDATVYVWGTWDDAVIAFDYSPDGVNWSSTGDTYSENSMFTVPYSAAGIRASLSVVNGNTSLNAVIL